MGGGASGLVTGKAMKEAGLTPTIFETSSHVGGIWSPVSRHLHQTMRTNVSKHMCSFSDFPWDSQTAIFPTASEVGQYLENYAQKFLLHDAIFLNSRVTQTHFNKTTNKWKVTVQSTEKEATKVENYEFDYLVVASGFFSKTFIPSSIPGLENFSGKIYHSSEANILLSEGTLNLKGKRVAVIGGSLSGVEISARLPFFYPDKIYHVTKLPVLVLPRYLPEDPSAKAPTVLPNDLALFAKIPPTPSSAIIETEQQNLKNKHAFLAHFTGNQGLITPELQVCETDPVFYAVSDTYAEYVRCGAIEVVLGKLDMIDNLALTIKTTNGTINLANIDTLIMATGYSTNVSYFDEGIVNEIEYDQDDMLQPLLLHKMMLHPKLKQAAFVGMYKGPLWTVMELQARYAAAIFSGSLEWPSEEIQLEGISKEREIRDTTPRPQLPHRDYTAIAGYLANELQSYDRIDMSHVIAPKYNASKPATMLVELFESDLLHGKKGKWTGEAVMRNLHGNWKIERDNLDIGYANFIPDLSISNIDEGISRYSYTEQITKKGKESRNPIELYKFSMFESTILICDPLTSNTFCSLSFIRDEIVGLIATGSYLRDQCQRKLRFAFPFDGIYFNKFELEIEDTGSDGLVSKVCTKYTRVHKDLK